MKKHNSPNSQIFRTIFLVVLYVLLLSACATRGLSEVYNPFGAGGQSSSFFSVGGIPTPTPFMPLPPTPEGGEIPLQEEQPQGVSPEEGVPQLPDDQAQPIQQPEGQVTLLLLGSDQRPYEGGLRTDTTILITLNKELDYVNVTSFPRDLYITVPGYDQNRINTVYATGGIDLLKEAFLYNFGFEPDYYALVNFNSFMSLVDILGGIDVYMPYSLTDQREGYGQYSVGPGYVHMDGETALWYARSRGTSNDLERNRRQVEVITAIFYRVVSLEGVSRAPELYSEYGNLVETDMILQDILGYLPLATTVFDSGNINTYAVSYDQVEEYFTSGGAAVLLPKQEALREVMREALNSK